MLVEYRNKLENAVKKELHKLHTVITYRASNNLRNVV